MPNGYEDLDGHPGLQWPPVSAEVLSTTEGTVVKLTIYDETFVGVAKTHPMDMPGDPYVGRDLAMARALKKARRAFRDRAYRGVDKHERNLEARKHMKPPATLDEWEEARTKGWIDVTPPPRDGWR